MRRLFPPMLCGIAAVIGCTDPVVQFRPNDVHAVVVSRSRDVPAADIAGPVAMALEPFFGTPQRPIVPAALADSGLVTVDRIVQSAGQIASDEADRHTGLFREHCVRCHGVAGDGAGAAARWQWPYPRDFRPGVFKYKSTDRAAKPIKADLKATLVDGLPGSAMPTFATVPDDELDALVDYVVYLSIRGEVERRLMDAAIDELGYPDEPLGDGLAESISPLIDEAVADWTAAGPTDLPPPVAEDRTREQRIASGKAIFHGPIANCAGCHGPGGAGGVPTLDYDDWTKMQTTAIGMSPADRDTRAVIAAAGGLPPRTIDPRHLAGGVARGGADPQRLFRLIQNGIAGTPMPAVAIAEDQPGLALTPAEAWDLVDYVQFLLAAGEST